jgi:uncharacterized protein YndB with AHSA1/START domain
VPAADRELVLRRLFAAPRPLVFAAWTDPAHAAHWWGPKGFVSVACEMDVRRGGSWRRVMRSPGGILHRASGVYREIAAPERLVFTYAWEDAAGVPGEETLVSVTFVARDDGTELTLRQTVFATAGARDAHLGGWSSCFDRFAEYLAAPCLAKEKSDAAPGRVAR